MKNFLICLVVASNFIIGMPGDTWNDILTTFEFADKMVNHDKLLDYALFSIATPLPGTEMFETAMNMNFIPKDFKPENFYGFGKGVINSDEWSGEELQVKRAMEWDRINFTKPEKRTVSCSSNLFQNSFIQGRSNEFTIPVTFVLSGFFIFTFLRN